MSKLLTREEFRNKVFTRDNYRCVICGVVGIGDIHDRNYTLYAHHIIERRLWNDGGFYESNGASLCHQHHVEAEQTVLSCDDIRRAAGITKILHPEQFYDDVELDKWGNYIQPNGTRLRGELFYDESVQKILKSGNVLSLFVDYVKYPRTFHLDFSNPSKDDKIIKNYNALQEQEIVVSLKIDGENSNLYRDYFHARSLEFATGEDRGWVKALHTSIAHDIPDGWRICGENVYAKHSIEYTNLDSYFYVFSIWNERNECLSWGETVEWCELLGLHHVPILYQGVFDYNALKILANSMDVTKQEGFVIRPSRSFSYGEFKNVVCKWVRPNHVDKSRHHWRSTAIIPNTLKEKQPT